MLDRLLNTQTFLMAQGALDGLGLAAGQRAVGRYPRGPREGVAVERAAQRLVRHG